LGTEDQAVGPPTRMRASDVAQHIDGGSNAGDWRDPRHHVGREAAVAGEEAAHRDGATPWMGAAQRGTQERGRGKVLPKLPKALCKEVCRRRRNPG
jgi:hypothetical protein